MMRHARRTIAPAAAAIAVTMCLAGGAIAQSSADAAYPSRPIQIIVPIAAGGQTDFIARLVGREMSKDWGQPVVIENRPGANGAIGLRAAAQATADGYTLYVGNLSTVSLYEVTALEPPKPSEVLSGITKLIEVPQILVAPASTPATDFQEFVAYLRTGSKLNYPSAGIGSFSHVDMESFNSAIGAKMIHVPYKGAGSVITALIQSDVHAAFMNAGQATPHIRAGKFKAFATSWPTRLPEFPDIPTMAELGFSDLISNPWHGMFARRGTPEPIIQAVHAKAREVLQRPEIAEALKKQLLSLSLNESPQAFDAFVAADIRRWTQQIAERKIQVRK